MGTTSEKLQYLATTKTLLKNKINLTGANITTDTFRQYPTKLQNALLNIWNNEGEPIFTNWGTKVNAEGTNVKLDNTINARMKITPKGNTTQNGTPTPSSPVNVNVVSGDNEVVVCGKNIYNKATSINNKTFTTNTGVLTDNSNYITSDFIKVSPNTTYYVYGLTVVGGYDNNKNWVELIRNADTNGTFTTPNNCYYVRIRNYSFLPTEEEQNARSEVTYLTLGNQPITYEPYQGIQNYPISLGTTELCKIGTYQDYIYKTDKWYLHKEVGKVVLNGTQTFTLRNTTTNGTKTYAIDTPFNYKLKIGLQIYSNYFTNLGDVSSAATMWTDNHYKDIIGMAYYKQNETTRAFYINTTETLPTWFSSNNTIIYYVLATPEETEITNTTLINQLEQLKSATSYEGQTNISSGFMIVGASALGELE